MKPQRPHLAKDEYRYLGRNACQALWRMRPKDVIRVYVEKARASQFSDLLAFCAKNRKSYHLVESDDLERRTDSKHHDGVCVVAKEKSPLREQEFFRDIDGKRTLLLYLDGVGNPHNLGAILRTAAHFGVRYLAGARDELPRISPAANRISEGGAEHSSPVRVENPVAFFERLRKLGFQVYAFDPGSSAISLHESKLAEKSVFIMGAEVSGVSPLLRSLADKVLKIPGTGAVESLNVSVAAALAMAEFKRQESQGQVRIIKSR